MAKTEVYSWRVSPGTKRSLEDEARRRNLTLAQLIDQIAEEWLSSHVENSDAPTRIHAAANRWIGSISSGGGLRSERVRELVRERLTAKHGRFRSH